MTTEQLSLLGQARRRWADGWPPNVDQLAAMFAALDEAEAKVDAAAFDGLPSFQVGRY